MTDNCYKKHVVVLVASSNLRCASGNSIDLAINGNFFESVKDNNKERRELGFVFYMLCPKYNASLTPTAGIGKC